MVVVVAAALILTVVSSSRAGSFLCLSDALHALQSICSVVSPVPKPSRYLPKHS
jgi:hypothetical protein